MRRTDRQRDEQFARNLISRSEWAVLAMNGPDGPYAVPVSHVLEADVVYFHGATEGTKLDCIEADGRVSLVCVGRTDLDGEHFSTDYESAIANGTASIVSDDHEKRHALMLIAQKFAAGNLRQAPAYIDSYWNRTTVVRVDVDTFTAKARTKKKESATQ